MASIGFISNHNNDLVENNLIVPIKFTHSCAIGQTGCGKTTSYIYPNLKYRIKNNHSILLYDYKGKEHLAVKYLADAHDRLQDVIEIGKDWGESINVIKYMNKADLEKMFLTLFGWNGKDTFWAVSSSNICIAVLEVLRLTDIIFNDSSILRSNNGILNIFNDDGNEKYDYIYNLNSLLKIVNSKESIINFSEKLPDIKQDLMNRVEESLFLEKSKDKIYLNKIYKDIFYNLEFLSKRIEEFNVTLNNVFSTKDKKQNSTTIDSIFTCINTPLITIANIEWLNCDKYDVIEGLENGGIISVNTASFSDSILTIYNNSIFMELKKRAQKSSCTPVSIFIDEAQKIISSNFDLPIDVLRECKVELFLSFQNSELMIEKIGASKFKSLYKNLKKMYLFRNPEEFEGYDLSSLRTFEYYTDESYEKKYSKAIFFNFENFFKTENKYQKINEIKNRYIIEEQKNEFILVYDSSLFSSNKVIVKFSNEKEKIVKIYLSNFFRKSQQKLNKMIRDVVPKNEGETSYWELLLEEDIL